MMNAVHHHPDTRLLGQIAIATAPSTPPTSGVQDGPPGLASLRTNAIQFSTERYSHADASNAAHVHLSATSEGIIPRSSLAPPSKAVSD